MRSYLFTLVLAALFSSMVTSGAYAQDGAVTFQPQTRLLLHGVHSFQTAEKIEPRHNWGMAFWFVEPDLLDGNVQGLTLIGPRLSTDNAWVELMLGSMAMQQPQPFLRPVLDTRFMVTKLRWVHFWGEGMMSLDDAYGFFQVDAPVYGAGDNLLFKLGAEVEASKTWAGSNGSIGVGPHVILPFGSHLTAVAAFQARCINDSSEPGCTQADLMGRLYLVLDFGG